MPGDSRQPIGMTPTARHTVARLIIAVTAGRLRWAENSAGPTHPGRRTGNRTPRRGAEPEKASGSSQPSSELSSIAPSVVHDGRGFSCGAKGIRTPDPHTASVVRYQLRHSPLSRARRRYTNQYFGFKTAAHGSSPAASGPSGRAGVCSVDDFGRVSGANTQPTPAASRITPLITNAMLNDRCWAI